MYYSLQLLLSLAAVLGVSLGDEAITCDTLRETPIQKRESTEGLLHITWQEVTADVQLMYHLEGKGSGGDWFNFVTTNQLEATIPDAQLESYRVVVFRTDCKSPSSACDEPESVPTTPSLVSQESPMLQLAWQAPTTSRKLLMYHVEVRSGAGDWYNLLSTLAEHAQVPDLSIGGRAFYRVVAVYEQCQSPSDEIEVEGEEQNLEGGGATDGAGRIQSIPFLAIYDAQEYTVTVTLQNTTESTSLKVQQSSCTALHCVAKIPNLTNGRKYTYTIRANTGQQIRGGRFTAGTRAKEQPPLLLIEMNRYFKEGQEREYVSGDGKTIAHFDWYDTWDHLYTTDELQIDRLGSNDSEWEFEGTTASLMADNIHQCPEAVPLYRLYHGKGSKHQPNRPWFDHLLTAKETAKNDLQKDENGRWLFEGVMGYCMPKRGQCGATVALHALFNTEWHDHWYRANGPDASEGDEIRYDGIECYAWRNDTRPMALARSRHKFDFELPQGSVSYTMGIRSGQQGNFEPLTGNKIGNVEETCTEDLRCRVILPSLDRDSSYQVKVTPTIEDGAVAEEIVVNITAGRSQQTIPFWGATNATSYTVTIVRAGEINQTTNKTVRHSSNCKQLSCKVAINNLVQSKQYKYYITTNGGMKLRNGHLTAGEPTEHLAPLTVPLYEMYHPYGKVYKGSKKPQKWSDHAYRNNHAIVKVMQDVGWLFMQNDIHLLPNKLQCPEATKVYQLYKPNIKDHMLQTSKTRKGWKADQDPGYCVPTEGACGATKPIYTWYSSKYKDHEYRASDSGSGSYKSQGLLCYGF